MPGVVRPPFGAPTGPLIDDGTLTDAFIGGQRTGHSATLHIEEDVLLADRLVPVAIRLGAATILMRTDTRCPALAGTVTRLALTLVEREPPLATVVALQAVGHSAAPWELWSADPRRARELLVAAAGAEQAPPR